MMCTLYDPVHLFKNMREIFFNVSTYVVWFTMLLCFQVNGRRKWCVGVWMCGCVDGWMCGCVGVWMCGLWMCGCVDVWCVVCGCVVCGVWVWMCGVWCVGVWMCGCVGVWVWMCGCVDVMSCRPILVAASA